MEVTIPRTLTSEQLEWLLNNANGEWTTTWHFVSEYVNPLSIHQTVEHQVVFSDEHDAILFVLSCL